MESNKQSCMSRDLRQCYDYPTRAVVLAAGRGQRLSPITDKQPKPLLSLGGRPLLDMILGALRKARVKETIIVVHHLAEQIVDFAGKGARWEMAINFAYQDQPLGTADALSAASSWLTKPCFVLAADYAIPEDYLLDLKRTYQESTADIIASLRLVSADELRQRSLVQLDEKGQISEIIEKPTTNFDSSRIGASLIYIVPPLIKRYLPMAPLSVRGEYELTDVLNLMIADGYIIDGLLQDPPSDINLDEFDPQ